MNATTMVERTTRTRRVVIREEAFGLFSMRSAKWEMRNGLRASPEFGILNGEWFANDDRMRYRYPGLLRVPAIR